jgi:GrpB-like predicted nucleotidyltransferase (UPF0157 family)
MDELFTIFAVPQSEITRRFDVLHTVLSAQLARLAPPCREADIQHIGSTAVPGCLTKGDLDVCVRVPPAHFAACEAALAQALARNVGSLHTSTLASFIYAHSAPDEAGVQLVAIGSEHDTFVRFRDLLLASPQHVEQYNALKRAWHGKPMDAYRDAKSAFVEALLTSEGRGPHLE